MNCNQAWALLATYRELDSHQAGTNALEEHLEQCASCRAKLAQYDAIGESIRLVPVIEPAPDAHRHLMQRLATEHAHYLQSGASWVPPVPDFLKSYVKEQAQSTDTHNALPTFSTADTSPLPIIRAKRKRCSPYMGQFAVLGLAATFLLVIFIAGLTSLLLLANQVHPGTAPNVISIHAPSQVTATQYAATTAYPSVTSAVATHDHIYYAAYGDSTKSWMIEQIDSKTRKQAEASTPLLVKPVSQPLIVLGASQDWLVWLQFNTPQPHSTHSDTNAALRAWSLYVLSLHTQSSQQAFLAQPVLVLNGTFDGSTLPNWVHTPVQGISFEQDDLLVAMVDQKGIAHLLDYQLSTQPGVKPISIEIAQASDGHVLTSPSANTDGTSIYWSEEWFSNNNVPHSNIWAQQITRIGPPFHTKTTKFLLRSDETSFHPQVVDNVLFFLTTNVTDTLSAVNSNQPTSITPTTHPSTTASATPTSDLATPVISKVAPNVSITQIDEAIHGVILELPSDDTSTQPKVLSHDGSAFALQGGTDFALWQSNTGYEMYDVATQSAVIVGAVTKDAAFLMVNEDTAVWTTLDQSASKTTNPVVTFKTFDWPTTSTS